VRVVVDDLQDSNVRNFLFRDDIRSSYSRAADGIEPGLASAKHRTKEKQIGNRNSGTRTRCWRWLIELDDAQEVLNFEAFGYEVTPLRTGMVLPSVNLRQRSQARTSGTNNNRT
jgi:hypothetical protein